MDPYGSNIINHKHIPDISIEYRKIKWITVLKT